MNIPTEREHIENNRTVLPFLGNKTPVSLPVANSTKTVPITFTTKIYILKMIFMILWQVLRRY